MNNKDMYVIKEGVQTKITNLNEAGDWDCLMFVPKGSGAQI